MASISTNVGIVRRTKTKGYNAFMFVISATINAIVCILDPNWILLDNQSTVDLFCNCDLLIDIHEVDEELIIHCNAGELMTNKMETLPGYGLVWYAKDAIANILSFANVFDMYDIDLVKKEKGTFIIRAPKNDIVFKRHSSGLYYHKVGEQLLVEQVCTH